MISLTIIGPSKMLRPLMNVDLSVANNRVQNPFESLRENLQDNLSHATNEVDGTIIRKCNGSLTLGIKVIKEMLLPGLIV